VWLVCFPCINHKPAHLVFSYVLSITQQYKQTAWKTISAIHPAIMEYRYMGMHSWNAYPISRYVKAITPQCRTHFTRNSIRSTSAIFMSHTEAITCLPKIVTLRDCKERMGAQRGTKVAPWCRHCSYCSWRKGTSQDEETLISKEIKSRALAILELYLFEGISKQVSKSINWKIHQILNFKISWLIWWKGLRLIEGIFGLSFA